MAAGVRRTALIPYKTTIFGPCGHGGGGIRVIGALCAAHPRRCGHRAGHRDGLGLLLRCCNVIASALLAWRVGRTPRRALPVNLWLALLAFGGRLHPAMLSP